MDKITTVGLDLAKQWIAMHAVDARGMLVLRTVLRRDALLAWSGALPPCVMAMEARGGAHRSDPVFRFRSYACLSGVYARQRSEE
jgi:hypothetical protein